MAEVKEELIENTEEVVEEGSTQQEEENVEDYFNPFADIDEKKEEVVEEKESDEKIEEDIKTEQKVDTSNDEIKEVKATLQAQTQVAKLIKENPAYAEIAEELVTITAKATVKGHSNPLEFAIRNAKPVTYWVEYGKKLGADAVGVANSSRTGGSSLGKSETATPDFNTMDSKSFEKYVNTVMRGA